MSNKNKKPSTSKKTTRGLGPQTGDLRVWWIPQVPSQAFYVSVDSVQEAKKLLTTLANYDMFQFDNKIKPDYCNAGGLEVYDDRFPAEDGNGWSTWYDDNGDELDAAR